MKFYTRLRELRNSREMSQQKLADILGISKSSINMYERGEREPGLELLETIADFFNVDMNYLLGCSDIPNKIFETEHCDIAPLYNKLYKEDKTVIRNEIKQMLKADKYKQNIPLSLREADKNGTPPIPLSPRKIAAYGADGTKQINPPNPRKIT